MTESIMDKQCPNIDQLEYPDVDLRLISKGCGFSIR